MTLTAPPPSTLELFEPLSPRSGKVRCRVCGRDGWPGGLWQQPCRAGHPWACTCGRRFSTRASAGHHEGHAAHSLAGAAGHRITEEPTMTTEQPPTMDEYLAGHRGLNDRSRDAVDRARAAQAAVDELGMGRPKPPPSAHDVEEAMRPYLGEVYELEQDAKATASRPTRLECAYRAALDHLLDLNGVHR